MVKLYRRNVVEQWESMGYVFNDARLTVTRLCFRKRNLKDRVPSLGSSAE